MGLGKTIQALAYVHLHPEISPVIIICPASLKLNWAQEIEACMDGRKIQLLEGTTPSELSDSSDIIIINYDVLKFWADAIKAIHPGLIITDEAHYFKSNRALRTKAVKKVAKGVPHFIALSGTPIVNRPMELFNALQIIDPSAIPSFWDYAKKYCGAKHNGFGWDFSGASNTEELHEKLTGSVMIRRKKKDVLKDLPDKVRSFIPFELSNKKEYKKAEDNFIEFIKDRTRSDLDKTEEKLKEELKETMEKYGVDSYDFGDHILNKDEIVKDKVAKVSNAPVLTQIESLKQLAVEGKIEGVIDWVRNFLEVDGKLVIFATHKNVIARLMKEFGSIAVKIDGSVSMEDRDKAVQSFQNNDKIQLFVGNIKAAGIGLTLTAASNVAFIELPWTPGDLDQAEDRCHRIGQKNSVNIHYLLAHGTIESELAHLLDSKRQVLDSVLDGITSVEESLLTELMNKYKNS